MATKQELKKFKDFKNDVLKHEFISNEELWILIRRHTQIYMGRSFFNETLKQKYYKFWIKRLEGKGIINQTGFNMWKVNPFDRAKVQNGQ